jgi:peptidoglycan-associated lipoprotein
MKKTLAIAAIAAFLAGCQSTPVTEPGAPVEDKSATTPGTGTDTAPIRPDGRDSSRDMSPLKDPKSILSKRSVFFDYDSDQIKEEFKPMVEAHARYLRENRSARMLVQGNADERGSREYNLALGQRRAEALKRTLVLLGATEPQIESVSLGEEKPRCSEATESCWAQNRRDDMLYQGEF